MVEYAAISKSDSGFRELPMWRPPLVTLLILLVSMLLPLATRAQQKPVAPTLRSARADVAASLPRHGGVPIGSGYIPPPLRFADLKVSATTAAGTSPGNAASQAKPFTREQVSKMVQAGLGDDSGAKLTESRPSLCVIMVTEVAT